MCDISSPVPSGAFAMDDKKMLYRPAFLLQYLSGRSANEAHLFLQETMKEQAPSRATRINWYRKFDNSDKSLEAQVDHIRRTDRSYSPPAVLDPIFLYANFQTLQILLSPQYTMFFGLLAKSRSCLESHPML
ncbi:unnamed protein product [Heligmosomoides polygyrus]|uniref:HTH_48 domain-containing protein n=1 Tax=Heligmosomoides polygyrus TaxID=6339 RepID=A0A183FHZ2_HELPZ|nr:unnamed protein product [Heligmosomoides polygyrus]